MRRVQQLPSRHRAGPFARNFRQRHDARPGILAALGVMRGGRRHAVRPFLGAGLHHRVKVAGPEAPCGGIAADLVEREQPVVAVERRCPPATSPSCGPVNCCTFSAKRRTRGALCGGAAGLEQVQGQGIAQEIEDAVVGGEPFVARLRDRLVDQLAIMRGRAAV